MKDHIADGEGEVDYVEVVDAEHLQPIDVLAERPAVIAVAAWFAGHSGVKVRLIDNMEMRGLTRIDPLYTRSLDHTRGTSPVAPTVT